MGVSYYSTRTTWWNGPTPYGSTDYQDDMAIIAGNLNGFGYRPDDFGSSIATATALPISGNSVNLAGLIGQNGDADYWKFTTSGATVNFQLAVASIGPDLDGVLEPRDTPGR